MVGAWQAWGIGSVFSLGATLGIASTGDTDWWVAGIAGGLLGSVVALLIQERY